MYTMPEMMQSIEAGFASAGRTPKGRKALAAIFRTVREMVITSQMAAMSLEAIANGAGLTQSALRHYFATREDLLSAFFVAASRWFRGQLESILADASKSPRDRLEQCVAWHLQYMEQVETVFWLEASAHWIRHPPSRHTRDGFYRWLLGQYARLIKEFRPELAADQCRRKAYVLMSLVLGSWITHGRGSAVGGPVSVRDRRSLLIDTAMAIVTQ